MERWEHKDCKNNISKYGIQHCSREFPWGCLRTQKEGLCPKYPLSDAEKGLAEDD